MKSVIAVLFLVVGANVVKVAVAATTEAPTPYCKWTDRCTPNVDWTTKVAAAVPNTFPATKAMIDKEVVCQKYTTEFGCEGKEGSGCKWEGGKIGHCTYGFEYGDNAETSAVFGEMFPLLECGFVGRVMHARNHCGKAVGLECGKGDYADCQNSFSVVLSNDGLGCISPPDEGGAGPCVPKQDGTANLCPGMQRAMEECTAEAIKSAGGKAGSEKPPTTESKAMEVAEGMSQCLTAKLQTICPEEAPILQAMMESQSVCRQLGVKDCASGSAKLADLSCKVVTEQCLPDTAHTMSSLVPEGCPAKSLMSFYDACQGGADKCDLTKCVAADTTVCSAVGAVPAATKTCTPIEHVMWTAAAKSHSDEAVRDDPATQAEVNFAVDGPSSDKFIRLMAQMTSQGPVCRAATTKEGCPTAPPGHNVIKSEDVTKPEPTPEDTSALTTPAKIGDTELTVEDQIPFVLGTRIILDAGTLSEEFNEIAGFADPPADSQRRLGSVLKLKNPLKKDHKKGATISVNPATPTTTNTPWDSSVSSGDSASSESLMSSISSFNKGSSASDLSNSGDVGSSGSTASGSWGSYLQIYQWIILLGLILCGCGGAIATSMVKPKPKPKKKAPAPAPAPEPEVAPLLAPMPMMPVTTSYIPQVAYAAPATTAYAAPYAPQYQAYSQPMMGTSSYGMAPGYAV